MQIEFSDKTLDKISSDALIVFAFEKDNNIHFLASFKKINSDFQKNILKGIETANFKGKRGELFNFYLGEGAITKQIIVLGLGKKEEFVADDLRRAMGVLSKKLKGKASAIVIDIPTSDELNIPEEISAKTIIEGLMLGNYEFEKYKSKNTESKKLSTIIFSQSLSIKIKDAANKATIYSKATMLARDLVNEQSAIATPSYLAKLATEIAKKDTKYLSCKIIDRKGAEKLGMEAFLGVARASDKIEPKFIHLEYNPEKKSKKKIAIVGKGITFDSGGINVKPGDSMIDMKMDMSGAAIVLAVFSVIAKLKPDYSVMGLIAATPNLISGSSLVPGDVVKALNGKTIEILNTDAEGRVTLADSLSYAVKEGATEIIDFATLTGACMVALGTDISGLFSNNEELASRIKAAAFEAGEKVWELPLEKDYLELNKSDVADVANIPNTRYGGTITAALFLQEFVGNTSWAHLDIAGPAFLSKPSDISTKGGTGHGVRLVLNLLS